MALARLRERRLAASQRETNEERHATLTKQFYDVTVSIV